MNLQRIPKEAYHQSLGRAGDSQRYYHPKRNWNRVINSVVCGEKYAFPRIKSALIVQQKRVPDVSFYQGLIAWDVMREKTDAIILRAGQNVWADSMFLINYTSAKVRGMLRGIYYFYDDRVSPGEQAKTLIELIENDLPEMEIWIDWERSYGGQFGGLKNVVAMMQAIEGRFSGARVGLYTGYYWMAEHSNAILNWSQYQYLKDKPLWLAYYADASAVKIPAPWTDLTYWQYGTPAVDLGQSSAEIDMSFFNGTISQFYNRYQTSQPTDNQTGVTTMRVIQGIAKGNVTRRASPGGSTFSPSRYLYTGDKIEADRQDTALPQWLHLTKINDIAISGEEWVSAGTSQQYIGWQWVEVVTDPVTPPVTPPAEPANVPDYILAHFTDGTTKKYLPE